MTFGIHHRPELVRSLSSVLLCLVALALVTPGRAGDTIRLMGVDDGSVTESGAKTGPTGGVRSADKPGYRVYRAGPDETFRSIARRVYGDDKLWPLIYYANRSRIGRLVPGASSEHVDLLIPPPPSRRVFRYGAAYYLLVLPGDTFRTIARSLYGRDDLWRFVYEANRDLLSVPGSAEALAASKGAGGSVVLRLPRPSASLPAASAPLPAFPPEVRSCSLPTEYVSPRVGGARLAGTGSPLARLRIDDPSRIDRRTAEIILRETGYLGRRNPSFALAMRALERGFYGKGGRGLDRVNRERLFLLYRWHREALARWGGHPEISQRATPRLYSMWVDRAAARLTSVHPSLRRRLLVSLMTTESGRTQWKNYRTVVSTHGAVGIGQFLPATAQGLGINPFDPQQNIEGIALYLDRLIRRHGLRKGLAAYNGGSRPGASSYAYADRILRRAGIS